MKSTKYITSKFFIEPSILNLTVYIIVLADIFLSEYIPKDIRPLIEVILIFIYLILFLSAIFYLFFKSFSKWSIESKIEKLEKEKEKKIKYNEDFENENTLLLFKKAYQSITDEKLFVHLLKTKEELTNMSNISNYFLVLLIFFVGQFSIDYLKPIGVILFIIIVAICIVFCFRISVWEGIERKNFISSIIIGHILVIYLLFICGKNTYIRNYGDEIIGSYFEKTEYRTQYYINAFSDDKSSKNYRLPATIHVYSETEEEDEIGEGFFVQDFSRSYTSKYIILETIYWPNGGSLDFDECRLKIGEKVSCTDDVGKEWYIELTDQKVK